MTKPCDICGKAEAKVTVSRLGKDGKPMELGVCIACAGKHGFAEAAAPSRPASKDIIADLKDKVAAADAKLVCSRCGMTFAEFKRLGRVGCAECYSAFASQLEPLVRRIHGSCQHVGRGTQPGPKPAQEKVRLEQLRDALAAAVEQEDYEKAASLRDALARCEDESGGG